MEHQQQQEQQGQQQQQQQHHLLLLDTPPSSLWHHPSSLLHHNYSSSSSSNITTTSPTFLSLLSDPPPLHFTSSPQAAGSSSMQQQKLHMIHASAAFGSCNTRSSSSSSSWSAPDPPPLHLLPQASPSVVANSITSSSSSSSSTSNNSSSSITPNNNLCTPFSDHYSGSALNHQSLQFATTFSPHHMPPASALHVPTIMASAPSPTSATAELVEQKPQQLHHLMTNAINQMPPNHAASFVDARNCNVWEPPSAAAAAAFLNDIIYHNSATANPSSSSSLNLMAADPAFAARFTSNHSINNYPLHHHQPQLLNNHPHRSPGHLQLHSLVNNLHSPLPHLAADALNPPPSCRPIVTPSLTQHLNRVSSSKSLIRSTSLNHLHSAPSDDATNSIHPSPADQLLPSPPPGDHCGAAISKAQQPTSIGKRRRSASVIKECEVDQVDGGGGKRTKGGENADTSSGSAATVVVSGPGISPREQSGAGEGTIINKDQNERNNQSSSASESEQNNNAAKGGEEQGAAKAAPEPPKPDYIHVRARRGQATDSHSLAERVRREKISERMKYLQDLVPGCSKVTGKAMMLDEIINYVQSLQRQVEFLSLKLASVHPSKLELNFDTLFSVKERPLNHVRFPGQDPLIGGSYSYNHLDNLHLQTAQQVGASNSSAASGLTSDHAFAGSECVSEMEMDDHHHHHHWGDDADLQNIVQMGFPPPSHLLLPNNAT